MNLMMVYAPLVCVLVMTRISVDTQTVTFVYTTTGKWIASSESSGPASPSTPLVGCSVLATSTRLSDHRYVSEQTSWTCDISTASSLQTYQQLQKKVLFMICRPSYMCKYTFSLEPGVVKLTLVQMFIVTERVKEVHYHQASNKILWITLRYGSTIHFRLAKKRSVSRKRRVPSVVALSNIKFVPESPVIEVMSNGYSSDLFNGGFGLLLSYILSRQTSRVKVITFAIDNHTDIMFIMSREDLHVYHIINWAPKRLQHFAKRLSLSDRLQPDMYNRKVYYTWRSRQVINALSYNGTPEIVINTTSVKTMKTFVVDAKGSKVYTCEGDVWSIYNMNTTKTTSLQTEKGVACDAPAIHGRELYLSGPARIQVVSMDSDESITTLILPKQNRRPSVYLPEIF